MSSSGKQDLPWGMIWSLSIDHAEESCTQGSLEEKLMSMFRWSQKLAHIVVVSGLFLHLFFSPLSVTKGCLADRHLKQLQSIELPPGTNLTCFHFYLWQQYLVVSCTVTMLRLKLTEEVKELLVHSFCGKVGHLLGSRCVTSTVLSNRLLTVWKRC